MNDVLAGKSTADGLDTLAAMLPHMEAIIRDEAFNRLKDRVRSDGSLTISDIMGDAFNAVAVRNRAALLGIVAAATGKTPDEVAFQPLEETISVFQGAMGSKVLDFFPTARVWLRNCDLCAAGIPTGQRGRAALPAPVSSPRGNQAPIRAEHRLHDPSRALP